MDVGGSVANKSHTVSLCSMLYLTVLIIRQRKASSDQNEVPKRAKLVATWDRTTFRVRNVPAQFDGARLQQVLANIVDLEEVGDVKVHSLSHDAPDGDQQRKAATVSFRVRPAALAEPSNDWIFRLPDLDGRSLFIDTHFKGFTPLSPRDNTINNIIDCIAIHGWGAHAFGSFRGPDGHYMWLRDSLPQRFPQLRVWIYGYDSNLQDPRSAAQVDDYAVNFVWDLHSLRRKTQANQGKVPIIYIAHSLGGWLFKEAIITMKNSELGDNMLNLQSTYGALLFGVPSQGMDVRALTTMVKNLPSRDIGHFLDQNFNFRLRNKQHQAFCDAFDYKTSKIVHFFEQKMSPTVQWDTDLKRWCRDGPPALLVNQASATYGRVWESGPDNVVPLFGDHSRMVKFAENNSQDYDKVLDILDRFLNRASQVIEDRFRGMRGRPFSPLTT